MLLTSRRDTATHPNLGPATLLKPLLVTCKVAKGRGHCPPLSCCTSLLPTVSSVWMISWLLGPTLLPPPLQSLPRTPSTSIPPRPSPREADAGPSDGHLFSAGSPSEGHTSWLSLPLLVLTARTPSGSELSPEPWSCLDSQLLLCPRHWGHDSMSTWKLGRACHSSLHQGPRKSESVAQQPSCAAVYHVPSEVAILCRPPSIPNA